MQSLPVVVFGNGTFASVAWYSLTHDTRHHVVAFTVDRAFMRSARHEGLPVVAFEELAVHYPPGSVQLLISLGYRAINGLRRERYLHAKALGYEFVNYISSRASIWPDLEVGENCQIYECTVVQPFARLGNNVIVRPGGQISQHCQVADHAFLAGGVTLGDQVMVGKQAFLGVGAVLCDGVTIAERSFIGAGAVVLADTEADAVYVGNPARKSAA